MNKNIQKLIKNLFSLYKDWKKRKYIKIRLITAAYFLMMTSGFVACQSKDPETGYPIIERDKTFVIGPYRKKCSCFVEKQCLVINGKTECEGIRGFTHEKGVQKTILVDVYERPDTVQDVGKYGYILKRIVEEKRTEEK